MPIVIRRGMKFLEERNIADKQEKLLKEKIKQACNSNIGKKIGLEPHSPFERVPLTTYSFYKNFYLNPVDGDLMYPLNDYLKVYTSGSMGKPKTFLIPKKGMMDNMAKSSLSLFVLTTHDGEKVQWKAGDTMFRNAPGGSFMSGFYSHFSDSDQSFLVRRVPEVEMSYQKKVDYFVEN